MKRTISLFLALVFALTALCCAASAQETFKTPYFTLTLPNGWLIDTSEADAAVNKSGEQYLGIFGDHAAIGLVVEADLVLYNELKDVSLWNYSEAELKDYADSVMEEFEGEHPEYLGVVKAGQIPFVLIKATDEDGDYLYADTMTNGYAVVFYAYVAGDKSDTLLPMSDADWAQVESILATFKPVG